jgi:hypothetical protein
MPTSPATSPAYPGRPELDTANARFRRALARLARETRRHDPTLMPRLTAIVGEATEHLHRLAADAEETENSSTRNRKAVADADARLKSSLRRAARRGSPEAARLLARVENAPLAGLDSPDDAA